MAASLKNSLGSSAYYPPAILKQSIRFSLTLRSSRIGRKSAVSPHSCILSSVEASGRRVSVHFQGYEHPFLSNGVHAALEISRRGRIRVLWTIVNSLCESVERLRQVRLALAAASAHCLLTLRSYPVP